MPAFDARLLRIVFSASAILPLAGLTLGQDRRSLDDTRFEVASVRLAEADACSAGRFAKVFKADAARVDIRCLTFGDLIEAAFGILGNRLTTPDWTKGPQAPKFDISAKLPAGASEEQIPAMLEALLIERLNLMIHRETKELPGYGLVVANGGLKAKPASTEARAGAPSVPPDPLPPSLSGRMNVNGIIFREAVIRDRDGRNFTETLSSPRLGAVGDSWNADGSKERLEAAGMTFEGLADLLTVRMGQEVPIVDMTGVKGRYQVYLDVSSLGLGEANDGPASSLCRPQPIHFERAL